MCYLGTQKILCVELRNGVTCISDDNIDYLYRLLITQSLKMTYFKSPKLDNINRTVFYLLCLAAHLHSHLFHKYISMDSLTSIGIFSSRHIAQST